MLLIYIALPRLLFLIDTAAPVTPHPRRPTFMVVKRDPTGEADDGGSYNGGRKLETHLCVRVRRKGNEVAL